jgi:hypothetical protein
LILLPDTYLFQERHRIIAFASKHRMPSIYQSSGFAEDGVAYGPDISYLHRRAGIFIDKILKGARPECPRGCVVPITRPLTGMMSPTMPREITERRLR